MSKCILMIEDHEENRRLLRDLLTSVGYMLIEAVNGEDGVIMAENHRPDLILMDIQLPGVDGYETTRRIKAQPALRHIPIIAVTSYAMSGDDVKALEAGCDAYVTKPFSPRALLAKIREYLPQTDSEHP
jgi:two-component system cell cycle response regulator DivK